MAKLHCFTISDWQNHTQAKACKSPFSVEFLNFHLFFVLFCTCGVLLSCLQLIIVNFGLLLFRGRSRDLKPVQPLF